jgi:nucleoside-diphosphate-sugar epimerase
MRVALTGGTGFVGANLTRALLRYGYEVHLLNRASYANWRIERIAREVGLHIVDLADAEDVKATLRMIRPELIFHLAQHGGYSWQSNLKEMISTNYLGCINLLQGALDVDARVVVNTGSSSEYGLKQHATSERDCPEPNSDYAATKAAGTLYCQQWARRLGRAAPTLRLYSVYGPFEEPMRLLPRVVSYGLEGRFPPLVDPHTARDFVYVDDVIDAYLRAGGTVLQDRGAIYNICSGQQTTLREVVHAAQHLLEVTAQPTWNTMGSRAWDTNIWIGNSDKAVKDLGWKAVTSLEQGLRRFVNWMQREPGMREHYRKATRTGSEESKVRVVE